jgi:hypothetical protein
MGTRDLAYLSIRGNQMGPTFGKAVCWLIFLPEVSPTQHILAQDVLSHLTHACLNCTAPDPLRK